MASSSANRCQHGNCLNFIEYWCHARCCSGETGLCRLHWEGSRHQREFFYEQVVGEMLPQSVDDCATALAAQEACIAAELAAPLPPVAPLDQLVGVRAAAKRDAHERRLADLRLVADLLRTELAALTAQQK